MSFHKNKNRVRPPGRTLRNSTYDMYNRAFPVGNALLFFAGDMMSLFRLPHGKLPLTFLAVPAGKDRRVECPCQTFDGFIGIRGSVCGLFLFVQTHAPLIVPPWQSRARKSKFQFHVRRKGADAFRPALAAGGSLMAYKCLSLCDFFIVQHFFKLCHIVRAFRADMLERCHTVHPEFSRRSAEMRSGRQVRQGLSLGSARCPHRQN